MLDNEYFSYSEDALKSWGSCSEEESRQNSWNMRPFHLCLVFWLYMCEAETVLSKVCLY